MLRVQIRLKSWLVQIITGTLLQGKLFEEILVPLQLGVSWDGFFLDPPTIHKTKLMSFPIWSYLESLFSNGAKASGEMADILKRFWDVESLGTVDTDCESELIKRKGEIKFNGSHYEVGLPWKGDCLPQSNNYGMCVTRLRSSHLKLRSDTNLLKECDNIIQEQKKNGIVEIVPETEHQTLE